MVPGVRKTDFYDFSGNFLRKNGLEYGITSETTETRDPRVRRRKPGMPASRQALHVVTDFPFYGFFNNGRPAPTPLLGRWGQQGLPPLHTTTRNRGECGAKARFRVSVVSFEIPGIVVSLVIPVFRIFSRKNSGKILNIGFSDSQDQIKITKFL